MTDTPRTDSRMRLGGIVRQAWRDLLSVYYANTPVWRWLKSGSLVFLRLFLWMSGNVLLAYWTDSVTVRYALAYGFVLILWGPLTPARRAGRDPAAAHRGEPYRAADRPTRVEDQLRDVPRDRRGRGTLAPGVMLLDFSSGFGTDGGDVTAELVCQTDSDPITCELETAAGVDHVVLLAGGEEIDRNDEPPYAVSAPRDSLSEGHRGRSS